MTVYEINLAHILYGLIIGLVMGYLLGKERKK